MFYSIVAFLLSANEVRGKVMFLHLSDCPWSHVPSEGGGVSLGWWVSVQGGGCLSWGGLCPLGGGG